VNDAAPSGPALDPAALLAVPWLPPLDPDLDAAPSPALPTDHPRWQQDVVSISSRARAVLAAIVPVAIRVLTFWDHRLREIAFGRRTLSVDPAGCYRLR
jgi:hypothetical protein